MSQANERYNRAALERGLVRVFTLMIEENGVKREATDGPAMGMFVESLDDETETDLRDHDEEPLTLECLIEALWEDYGLVTDEGEAIEPRPEVPDELRVSVPDKIRALKERKLAKDENRAIADWAVPVLAKVDAYEAQQKAQRAADRAAKALADQSAQKELTPEQAAEMLAKAGFKVVVTAKPAAPLTLVPA